MSSDRKYRAVMVPVNGKPFELEVGDHRDIQKRIGCDCFDVVSWIFDDRPTCYVDDEGKINGSPANRAIFRGDELVDVLHGNMLFMGVDLESGESRDITDAEVDKVYRMLSNGKSGPGSGELALSHLKLAKMLASGKRRLKQHGKL